MRILLKHPLHGTKHAWVEAEAVADEKNGWVRQAEEPDPIVIESVDLQKEADPVVRNKPGPKPKAK